MSAAPSSPPAGCPTGPYDLIKEVFLAAVVGGLLVLVLSVVFSSPDVPSMTFRNWAEENPTDFINTTFTEFNGTSETATYGPPYNSGTAQVQAIGPFAPMTWFPITFPINPPVDFVINPLKSASRFDAELATALRQWEAADAKQQAAWLAAYAKALPSKDLKIENGAPVVPPGDYGPVQTFMSRMYQLAVTDALDQKISRQQPNQYITDYTWQLMYFGDSDSINDWASANLLDGSHMGMAHEVPNWPGQWWLTPYAFWYQVPALGNSSAADLIIGLMMVGLFAVLILVPFLPIVRDIPRWIPVYRIIQREWFKGRCKDCSGRRG